MAKAGSKTDKRSTKGQRRGRGPKLDETAAAAAYAEGKTLAQVARAAGSRASSERNARRVGHKVVQRVLSRGELLERFAAIGVNLDTVCQNIARRLNATRTLFVAKGKEVERVKLPDWQAQAKAAQQFMELTGLVDLPASPDSDGYESQVEKALDRLPDDVLVELDRRISELQGQRAVS